MAYSETIDSDQMLSVGEVAARLKVSPQTVRNYVEKRYLPAIRLPSRVRRIPEDEVERLMQEMSEGSGIEWRRKRPGLCTCGHRKDQHFNGALCMRGCGCRGFTPEG